MLVSEEVTRQEIILKLRDVCGKLIGGCRLGKLLIIKDFVEVFRKDFCIGGRNHGE